MCLATDFVYSWKPWIFCDEFLNGHIWVVLIKNGKMIHLGHFTQNFGSSFQYEGNIQKLWKLQQLYRIAARFSQVYFGNIFLKNFENVPKIIF